MSAGPFFKWVGSKRKLAARIVGLFPPPSDVKFYAEPFLGGGAVFFEARRQGYRACAELADTNADLVLAWQALRAWNPRFIQALARHEKHHSPEHYRGMREVKAGTRDLMAARFLYLNKAGFNGLWRVNASGQYNVPIGDKFRGFDLEALKASAEAIGDADIATADYATSLRWLLTEPKKVNAERLIYLDPPYPALSDTANFTRYAKKDFGVDDHERLADMFEALADRGVRVVLSNADIPFVRKLYKRYNISEVTSRRSVSAKASTRGHANELIIRSWA